MRKTYCEVNLVNLEDNVKRIISKFNNYAYYFGVVKADCYGHGDLACVKAVIDGGCNYLAVATVKEALFIREEYNDIPILCLGCVYSDDIKLCIENNITISICHEEQLKDILKVNCEGLKVHIKLNTGMNRLGISSDEALLNVCSLIDEHNIYVEGVYSHIYDAFSEVDYNKQVERFEYLLKLIDRDIPIIHIAASDALVNYDKLEFINGCRLGIIMYGFNDKLELNSTFKVISEVIQINTLNKGDTLGYNAMYKASIDGERIAVIPIGYADGIIRRNSGRSVYINDKKFRIVGNICMDMLFVKVDDSIKLHDRVMILKDNEHINEVCDHLETIPYEVMCSISKRVERVYVLK